MKTSRIARETARVTGNLTTDDFTPRRQTRSFAASLAAFTANDGLVQENSVNVKEDNPSDSDCSLSSAQSVVNFDIEDAIPNTSTLLKRKRGLQTPSTTISITSTTTSTRTSPRKANTRGRVKKAKRQPAIQSINEDGEVQIHAPVSWEKVYGSVKEMRKHTLAPVDTMGCESLAEEHLSPRVCSNSTHFWEYRLIGCRTSASKPS